MTPNIDSLRKKGLYFTNAFSSVDGTILSLKTIFHSNFPIKTGSRTKLTLEKNNLLTIRAAENVIRILPPLNVKKSEIDQAIRIIDKVCDKYN